MVIVNTRHTENVRTSFSRVSGVVLACGDGEWEVSPSVQEREFVSLRRINLHGACHEREGVRWQREVVLENIQVVYLGKWEKKMNHLLKRRLLSE